MALLSDGLLPASFRGAPFAVEADDLGGGRRQAVHTYPGKDDPWAEDMGRAPRTFSFRGFIVDSDVIFLGGPIQLQRALLLAAFEAKGPGTLTHPTLGVLSVSVQSFRLGQDLGAGRKSSVDVTFVESGKKSFPSLLSSGSGLLSAATLCDVAIAADFARAAILVVGGIGASSAAVATGSACAEQVATAAQDATAIQSLAAQLPGNFGRYAGGATVGFAGSAESPYANDTTVDALITDAANQRAAVNSASAGVIAAADGLADTASLNTLSAAMTSLVASLLAACANPADAVRLLEGLIENPPAMVAASSAIGASMVMLFRRAAATALSRACASYQPASYDDAFSLLSEVSGLLDDVSLEAADAGDDASYDALIALRAQVVQDLQSRGAVLAPIRSFTLAAAMPALALAQQLYGDPSRADQLVQQVDPVNPLFMPISFEALAA